MAAFGLLLAEWEATDLTACKALDTIWPITESLLTTDLLTSPWEGREVKKISPKLAILGSISPQALAEDRLGWISKQFKAPLDKE